MNTNIENCNFELLNEQKEQLTYEITQGESSGFFNVFDIEAGCRKTRTAESALIEAYYKYGRKSILVRRNDEDCRESMRIINKAAKSDIAFAYNNEDVTLSDLKNVNKNLNTIPIVIITHQKYRVLMKDTNKRKLFSTDRKNLIVDEFVSAIEVISVSETDIETFRILFKSDPIISLAFEKSMKWIVDFFMTWNKENSCRRFVNIDDEHPSKNFNELIKLIKANVTNEILTEWKYGIFECTNPVEININLLSSLKTVKMLCDRLMEYKQLFTEMCVYNDKKLYTTDPRNNYWFLDNNIMLDASGELQSAYALNYDEFSLQHCEKVLNHSNWKIINIPVNTTSAGKERIINFYDVVNEEIKKYGKDILVIGKKNEMDMIDVPEDNKGYFGNVTGSNKWYDIKNVAIIQTHNLSDVDYILKYLHYGNHPFLLSYTTQSKIAVPLSEKPAPKKVTKKAHESKIIIHLGDQCKFDNNHIRIQHHTNVNHDHSILVKSHPFHNFFLDLHWMDSPNIFVQRGNCLNRPNLLLRDNDRQNLSCVHS